MIKLCEPHSCGQQPPPDIDTLRHTPSPFPLHYQTLIIYCNISPQCDLNVSHVSPPPPPACFNHAPGLQYKPLFLCGLTGGVSVTNKQVLFCGSAKSLKSKLKKNKKTNKKATNKQQRLSTANYCVRLPCWWPRCEVELKGPALQFKMLISAPLTFVLSFHWARTSKEGEFRICRSSKRSALEWEQHGRRRTLDAADVTSARLRRGADGDALWSVCGLRDASDDTLFKLNIICLTVIYLCV